MKYILVFTMLIVACGGTDINVKSAPKLGQCFANCENNADCQDGLWCFDYENLQSVCLPKECANCYADGGICGFERDYADDLEYPVCTFVVCLSS